MRPGVHLAVQSPILAHESTASPSPGQAQKQRHSGWLRKNASTADHLVNILSLEPSDNNESPLELENLAKPPRSPSGDNSALSRESRRSDKRLRKLERLAEQEEMKFSHSIQFNAVPDWSSNYISYSNLKKL
jgi:hypothetical protein